MRPDTTAILATHVYGYPCDHAALAEIADRHGLLLLYDAAHAFDVSVAGQSILSWGDASTMSFHATKVFHTIEGGAVVTENDAFSRQLDLLRSFGHAGRDYFTLGINGKNSELHCGIGLLNLPRLPANCDARARISNTYHRLLAGLPVRTLDPNDYPGLKYNYAYFPVFFRDLETRERITLLLNAEEVYPRRYFEPSLNELPFLAKELQASCPVSEHASRTALCLPLYPDLAQKDVRRICAIITQAFEE